MPSPAKSLGSFQFSVLFTNICASKTFFAQERTLTTFGTSTRLNFMPLRADESIKTHPNFKTTDYTHTHFYFPLVDEIKAGFRNRSVAKQTPTLVRDIESSEDIPDCYPILSLQRKVQAKGRSQERIHATPEMKWPKRIETFTRGDAYQQSLSCVFAIT